MDTDDGKSAEKLKMEKDLEMCKLLAAILHLLSSAATPVASSSDVRELATGDKLPFLLKAIFEQPDKFGATVYEKASALLTEFVHQEPGCLQVPCIPSLCLARFCDRIMLLLIPLSLQYMLSSGVAASFLASLDNPLPPSRGVVNAIREQPSLLLHVDYTGCRASQNQTSHD